MPKATQQTKREALQRLATKLANDPKVRKSVAQSRADFETGRTLTSDQALPAITSRRARA